MYLEGGVKLCFHRSSNLHERRHVCEHLNEAGVMCARCECLVLGVTFCVLVCCE